MRVSSSCPCMANASFQSARCCRFSVKPSSALRSSLLYLRRSDPPSVVRYQAFGFSKSGELVAGLWMISKEGVWRSIPPANRRTVRGAKRPKNRALLGSANASVFRSLVRGQKVGRPRPAPALGPCASRDHRRVGGRLAECARAGELRAGVIRLTYNDDRYIMSQ